eukprot:337022-Rhodomonas_salina.1
MVKSCRKPSRRTASCHSTAMKISPINNLTEGFHSVKRSSKMIEMLPSRMSFATENSSCAGKLKTHESNQKAWLSCSEADVQSSIR